MSRGLARQVLAARGSKCRGPQGASHTPALEIRGFSGSGRRSSLQKGVHQVLSRLRSCVLRRRSEQHIVGNTGVFGREAEKTTQGLKTHPKKRGLGFRV